EFLLRVDDVDGRRHAGDGDRFLDRADLHLTVHLRGKRDRHHDALAAHRLEARERERLLVHTGRQIDDLVLTRAVGYRGAGLFNQRFAGYFDGDARHDRATGISDGAGDAPLSSRGDWHEQDE